MWTEDMQERRSINRWQVNRPCEARLEGAEGFASCAVKDVSLKGIQISLKMKLPKDSFLKFSIFLEENFTLDIEAWVVWHRTVKEENCYGLYFSKIKDLDKERIYKFVCGSYPKLITQCWWRSQTEEKGGEKMEDRRIFARIPVKFPLRYLEPNSGTEGQAQIQDISAKGLGFVAEAGLPRKASLEIWIEIPDKGEPFYTRGDVVWSQRISPDKHRLGINLEKADLMGLSRAMRAAG